MVIFFTLPPSNVDYPHVLINANNPENGIRYIVNHRRAVKAVIIDSGIEIFRDPRVKDYPGGFWNCLKRQVALYRRVRALVPHAEIYVTACDYPSDYINTFFDITLSYRDIIQCIEEISLKLRKSSDISDDYHVPYSNEAFSNNELYVQYSGHRKSIHCWTDRWRWMDNNSGGQEKECTNGFHIIPKDWLSTKGKGCSRVGSEQISGWVNMYSQLYTRFHISTKEETPHSLCMGGSRCMVLPYIENYLSILESEEKECRTCYEVYRATLNALERCLYTGRAKISLRTKTIIEVSCEKISANTYRVVCKAQTPAAINNIEKTVESVITAIDYFPDVPWLVPVQGWFRKPESLLICLEYYEQLGILDRCDYLAIANLCNDKSCEIVERSVKTVHRWLKEHGYEDKKLHVFDLSLRCVERVKHYIHSFDTMAWTRPVSTELRRRYPFSAKTSEQRKLFFEEWLRQLERKVSSKSRSILEFLGGNR